MKISFSSVKKYDSHISFEIAPKTQDQMGRFIILSYDLNNFDNSYLESTLSASIHDNIISLTADDQKLPGKLQIGNKSINQLKLWQQECRIPDTVILDFSFSDVFKKNGKIALDDVFRQHIAKKLDPSIAIRCSSNLEDSERKSFTGVFDTYLNVENNFAAFEEKVLRSYQKFCTKDNISEDIRDYEPKLAIMAQNMVKPHFSGFLFTEDPMNPPNTWLKIEYWRGEREKSEGYDITLSRESGKRISSSQDEGRAPLPIKHLEKLHRAANVVHKHYGFPQDIEFVFDEDEQLYLVQSRPITAFNYSPHKVRLKEQKKLSGIAEENRKHYQKDPILSSTNISELFVQAVPLGYSIFKYGFAGARKKEGGISRGRFRLGYAKLEKGDQIKFFYTVGDQARTNIIVDALTFRLPGISKTEYLDRFLTCYLEKIKQNPAAASYPENGLYLQSIHSERWHEIAGEKGETFRKEYLGFLEKIITVHAPREYSHAGAFFKKNERFYRSYLSRDLHTASEHNLKEEAKKIMEYLRIKFCPQYVVFARLAFLCTHLAKENLDNLLTSTIKFSKEQVLNELLQSINIETELIIPNYPHFERLLKAGKITMWDFLDRFQHLGSLDIHQPRLGEYSINDLQSIFGMNKKYEHGDGRLLMNDNRNTGIDPKIAALDLDKKTSFWNLCTFAGKFMSLREKAKYELLKLIYILKRIIIELARIYRLGDLIFFLEYDELLKLEVNNREAYRLFALQRKAYFEACRQFQVQDVILDFQRAPFKENNPEKNREIGKKYKSIKGKSVFYGYAQGVCLTAINNEEYIKKLAAYKAENIEPIIGVFKGVELSYFNLGALAGFTTEHGGYLSHAATIAREFKIPYITGISFEEFEDGNYVILDTENEQVIY